MCPGLDPGTEEGHYRKTGEIQIKSEVWLLVTYKGNVGFFSFDQVMLKC